MKNKTSLAVFTISHMVVDFSCFYILMGTFSKNIENLMTISFGFLLYNLLAFGLQAFIGYLADQHYIERSKLALIGCFLVCLGVLFFAFNITMSITLWGMAIQLPNQPGFAFGLTTLTLLVEFNYFRSRSIVWGFLVQSSHNDFGISCSYY